MLVNATFGSDAVKVTAAGPEVRLTGLAATTVIHRSDPALDRLHLDTRPGADLVSVDPAVHQRLTFTMSWRGRLPDGSPPSAGDLIPDYGDEVIRSRGG